MDMKQYFLGIDIGATKSHALIADETGTALGFGSTGAGNWETVGWERTRAVFHKITDLALESARISKSHIAGAGFGIAGYDWPEDLPPHQEIVNSLNLNAPTYLTNDTIIGLVAGATAGWGVVISAGTSNNCRGRAKNGREAYLTGSGEMFAENGGAHQVMLRAVQSISLAWSLRGPKTGLTEEFIKITGAKDVTDLLAGLIRGRYQLSAGNAPTVFKMAKAGDEVAQEIVQWAGQELANLALGIGRQLDFLEIDFEVVLAGSLYKGAGLHAALENALLAEAPGAKLVRLEAPPVVGGVLLGMELAKLDIAQNRSKLIESTNQLLLAR
jgi:N-acetylglucosamine kinase-like BadF-type ATPase